MNAFSGGTGGSLLSQPHPLPDGALISDPQAAACPVGVYPPQTGEGAEIQAGDQGEAGSATTTTTGLGIVPPSSGFINSGGTFVYQVAIDALPAGARIVRCQVNYSLSGTSPSVQDDGGSASGPSPMTVEWGAAGIALLNAAMRPGNFRASVTCSFGGGPKASVSVNSFTVTYLDAAVG
jgi:hypothetical protein